MTPIEKEVLELFRQLSKSQKKEFFETFGIGNASPETRQEEGRRHE